MRLLPRDADLGLAALTLGLTLGLAGCSKASGTADAGAEGGTPTSVSDAASDSGVHPPAARGSRPMSPCRAASVTGVVAWGDGSDTVTDGATLPDGLFLTVADKASFTARDPRSLRETRFTGPATVRPCASGQERSDLAAGTFASTPGSGEAAGHEEWVVTGSAVVRYSAAAVEVRSQGLTGLVEIRPRGGDAFLWVSPYALLSPAVADAGAAGGWVRLSTTGAEAYRVSLRAADKSGAEGAAVATKSGYLDPDDAFVRDCLARAATAAGDADALRDAGPGFGAAARAHVDALKAARAACSIAELRAAYSFASAGDGGVADGAHRATIAIEAAMKRAKLGNPR